MAKNPFKKQSIVDTAINTCVGGAANVAIDYAVSQFDEVAALGDTTINAAKIALGAVVGSMVSNKIARAAADGVAVVGASNLISGLITTTDSNNNEGQSGVPYGTIAAIRRRVKTGNKAYRRAHKVSGVASVMGK